MVLSLLVLGVLLSWRVSSSVPSVEDDPSVTAEAKEEYLQAADEEEALLRGPEPMISESPEMADVSAD
ncbi:MAG: hypothetical protein GWN13_08760, partial [Phycisphaerae bacterium]|nr:hypothetical protein [Phycisphaerae bacterium]